VKSVFGVAGSFGSPKSSIPKHNGAAAIFAFGNRAFEISIVQRVIFNLDRQTTVLGIERGAFRHGPGFEHASRFQPQVEMKPGSGVLLNDEPRIFGSLYLRLAARFGGFREVALGLIEGKPARCHVENNRLRRARVPDLTGDMY
jgi:hypothetical protein